MSWSASRLSRPGRVSRSARTCGRGATCRSLPCHKFSPTCSPCPAERAYWRTNSWISLLSLTRCGVHHDRTCLRIHRGRRTLLDALDALESHRDSLVLIGAQAVYLHTGSTGLSVPPMTTDADLALNTDLLADDPEIATLLHAAGFENTQQPGHWENPQGIALDLMVAPHQSNRQSATARAANLGPHSKTVAR